MKKNPVYVLVIVAGLILTAGCQARFESTSKAEGRLAISTPDGHFYNLASDRSRLGSTGERFCDMLLSDSQMSQILHIVRKKHSLSWQDMTVENPYPKSHTVLLWYGSAPGGSDSVMCSLGTSRTAVPILQEVSACIPKAARQEFMKSVDRMKGTQQ
jgi:hypothetical protein